MASSSVKPVSLMLVEPNDAHASKIVRVLSVHFSHGHVGRVSSLAQLREADLVGVDLVLAEMDLPDGTGFDLLDQVLYERPDLPVVFVTSRRMTQSALQAIEKGAADYVVRAGDYLFALPVVIEKTLAIWRTKHDNVRLQSQLACTLTAIKMKNHELEQAVRKLEAMAATDFLTGLANRRAFHIALERAFAEAGRHGRDLACIMIDLDGFKRCNDMLGHQKGDELLQRTARVLEANCRRSDVPARFGGDEFVVLLPDTALERAKAVAARIADEMRFCASGWQDLVGDAFGLGMSMGIATLHHSSPATCDELLMHADRALYLAKAATGSEPKVYDPVAA